MAKSYSVATVCGLMIFNLAFAVHAQAANETTKSGSTIGQAGPALAPFQHVRFCVRNPEDCLVSGAGKQLTWDAGLARELTAVNNDVNAEIRPRVKTYRTSLEYVWEISPLAGDCNDYAVTKRHLLIKKGLPSKALRLAVVLTETGRGHLVLVVATTRGDIVLDNLVPGVRHWAETSYSWQKIQSGDNPRLWFAARAPSQQLASSRHQRKPVSQASQARPDWDGVGARVAFVRQQPSNMPKMAK